MSAASPLMRISAAGDCHTGRVRPRNEDDFLLDESLGLYLVADGMGGHERGDIASQTACASVVEAVRNGRSLQAAVLAANDIIVRKAVRVGQRKPMGTTLVAAQIVRDAARLVWVGDSRIYLFRNDLAQISHDHSAVQELVDAGTITAQQARSHPHRNVITQALGVFDNQRLDIGAGEVGLQPGDRLLLCSDGLTNEVDDAELAEILRANPAPQDAVPALMQAALDAGGNDNITALVIAADALQTV